MQMRSATSNQTRKLIIEERKKVDMLWAANKTDPRCQDIDALTKQWYQ